MMRIESSLINGYYVDSGWWGVALRVAGEQALSALK